jgi:catechol 2,3-dioxygenase-like lactoylglutathione lyase family enzyme
VAVVALFAGVATADIAAAKIWYERLFGRPPDMLPNDREACWQLEGAGWIYVVEDAERAGQGVLTVLVDDIDAQVAGLADRGIDAGPIAWEGTAARKSVVFDPEGTKIAFAQVATT